MTLYARETNKVLTFSNVGKMETEIFKLVDRITFILVSFMDKQKNIYQTKLIPKNASLGIITNLKDIYPFNTIKKLDSIYRGQIISRRQIHGFYEMEKKKFWLKDKDYNSYDVLAKIMGEIRNDLKDSFLRKILNIEYKLRLPEMILSRIDYPTMASSVEARSPYMDHELIEL